MTNNNSISFSGNLIDWLTIIFIVLWSGGAITYGTFGYWELFLFPVFLWIYIKRKCYSKNALILLILMLVVTLFQKIKFSGNNNAFLLAVIRWIDIYFIASYLISTNKFCEIFVKFITVTSAISLVFWFVDLTSPGHSFLLSLADNIPQIGWDNMKNLDVTSAGDSKCLWFYTVRNEASITSALTKNKGIFWEGGILAIYANLALYINIFTRPNIKNRTNLILLLTVISTFSTTGYLALMLLGCFVIVARKGFSVRSAALLLIFFTIAYGVMSLDFMTDKIAANRAEDSTLSRFGAMAYHWTQIVNSPFVGYGPFLTSSVADLYTSPNGWTNLLRLWGFPMAIVFLVNLFKSSSIFIPDSNNLTRIGFMALALILVFSQTLSTSIFYYFIYFVGSFKIAANQNKS